MTIVKLPIDHHLPAIKNAVSTFASVLVKAEPGTGKTTRVPSALLDVLPGKILVLEPRRLAARLSAERVAAERQESCGETVGYRIRFDAKETPRTRLTFVTEGLFLRILYDNPHLDGYSAVVIDEFHERNIQTDLAVAFCRQLQKSERTDLKLVIMSATLETQNLEEYLGECGTFDIKGRTFPIRLQYLPQDQQFDLAKSILFAVDRMVLEPECTHDILVFLTGIGEIRRVAQYLNGQLDMQVFTVLTLSSEASPEEQRQVFSPSPRKKIILATNVAETSITLPHITGVIDAGMAKIASHAPWSGLPTLEVKRISQASAIQRAGRAGRTAPGVVYRLFSERDYLGRESFTPPDIERLDLTPHILDILVWSHKVGLIDTIDTPQFLNLLPWFQKPLGTSVDAALRTLQYLGAINEQKQLTSLALEMANFPLHPRLARIILAGQENDNTPHALLAACIIHEDFLWYSLDRTPHHPASCDLSLQCDAAISQIHNLGHYRNLAIDRRRLDRVLMLYQNLARRMRIPSTIPREFVDHDRLGPCLLMGYTDRVAKRRSAAEHHREAIHSQYHFCLGRGGLLDRNSLAKNAEMILAIEASESLQKDGATAVVVRIASPVKLNCLADSCLPLFRESRESVFNPTLEKYQTYAKSYYGQFELTSQLIQDQPSVDTADLLPIMKKRWPYPFDNADDLETYHAKIFLLKKCGFDGDFPEFQGEMLDLLQSCICDQKTAVAEVLTQSLMDYIFEQLSWEQQESLRRHAPDSLSLANGRKLKVHYALNQDPWIVGYIQDFFGLTSPPTILGGRLPLVIHFLAPNKKPVQVTTDFAGFWTRSYPTLKKEFSRRYPRHNWADDPSLATPNLHKPRP